MPELPAANPVRTFLLTVLALFAFAANSILCRMALQKGLIDPLVFTVVRLLSGAVMLWMISGFKAGLSSTPESGTRKAASFIPSLLLLLYAAPFSFAYTGLTAATGALILFGCVQATMITAAIVGRQHPSPLQWVGLIAAVGGLVVLILPGLASPPLSSALEMALAGIAWGLYSLKGRGSRDPVGNTRANFTGASVGVVVLGAVLLIYGFAVHAASEGIVLAVISGALTSALGYVLWYAVLPSLGATRAAILQLSVPVLAAFLAVATLGEALSPRLGVAAFLTISGAALVYLSGR